MEDNRHFIPSQSIEQKWTLMHQLGRLIQRSLADDQFDGAVRQLKELKDAWDHWGNWERGDTDYEPTQIIERAQSSIVEAVARKINIYAVVTLSTFTYGELRSLNEKLARDLSR